MNPLKICANFDRADFLKNYWQKKPLLIRQMFPNFEDALTPEELAGLALEQGCESRLIQGTDPADWEVSHGPFTEEQFTSLPDDEWTLLVQAVDQWVEPVLDLKAEFDFIPSWRIDDIMLSFAADKAGVGPHFDYYDVFLIQGLGERTWQVGAKCDSSTKIRNYSGLQILDQFESEAGYTLKAGDVLYIPPQFAHWGVSVGRSLCYSVGFRAPSSAEVLEGFSDALIDQCLAQDRYKDGIIKTPLTEGEINPKDVEHSFKSVLKAIDNRELYSSWFGKNATSPRYPALILPIEPEMDITEAQEELANCEGLCKNPSSRFAYLELKASSKILLFVDGEAFELASDQLWLAQLVCSDLGLANDSDRVFNDKGSQDLFLQLLNQGSLVIY